jgi:transcriptional regulator GlxA family with amidase domain
VLKPHGTLPERLDVLIVPGGGWSDRAPQGAYAEAERGNLPQAIASLHAAGTTVASVCTGGMLLAASGVLTGRAAITHHAALEDLRGSGARVVEARVVDDGDVVTAGGVTSGLDLALWLVERYLGADLAAKVADELEYERRGEVVRKT